MSASPGPWTHAYAGTGDYAVYDANGEHLCSVAAIPGDVATEDADARLIAAAPELRALVRKLMGMDGGMAQPDDYVSARALLARIDGDS